MSKFSSQFPYQENGGSENSSLHPKKQHYQNEGWGGVGGGRWRSVSGGIDPGGHSQEPSLARLVISGAQGWGEDVLCWVFFFWNSLAQKPREGNLKPDQQEADKRLRLAPLEPFSEGQRRGHYPGHLPPRQPHPCG